jgi:amidase
MQATPNRRDLLIAAGAASAAMLAGGAHAQPASAAAAKPELSYRSAKELVATLATRQISAVELVDQSIARIEALDPRVNAVVVRDFDRARVAAREADAALSRGDRRPLLGLPMTVKEAFNVAGLPTTWGVPGAKGWQPAEDAVIVARAKAAGAIILGKTNVPLMLADFQSYNEIYGTTNNPWDLGRTPGGSSGGSAAALAAGFVSLELGSDFGGSLRVPAHYCGVYGHKPTHALVPQRGHTPPRGRALPGWSDLAVVGPMARTADDLALGLETIAGPDVSDSIAYRLAMPPPRQADLKSFRVLLIDTHPSIPTGSAVRTALGQLADRLTKAGCKVERSSPLLPDLAQTAQLYALLQNSIAGVDIDAATYERLQAVAASIPADAADLAAQRTRGTVLSYRDWAKAHRVRVGVQQQWRELFRSFDVVLCPIHPTPAWPHDHSNREARRVDIDGQSYPWIDTLRVWGGVATVPGLPATAAPIGLSGIGLPIGVQIIGPQFEDYTPIAFARLIEREFGGFVPPPGFR